MSYTRDVIDDAPVHLRAAMLMIAATLLGRAIYVSRGLIVPNEVPWGIAWLTGAIVVAALALIGPMPRASRATARQIALVVGLACIVVNFMQLAVKLPAIYLNQQGIDEFPRYRFAIVSTGLLAVAAISARPGPIRQFTIGLVLMAVLATGLWTIARSPAPFIDVFVFHRDATTALAGGANPYAMTFPDIYGGRAPWYTPELLQDGRVQAGYPYPPAELLALMPAHALGRDVRSVHLVAAIAAAALIGVGGRSRLTVIAAMLFISTPTTFLVIESAWTEPIQVLLLIATVLLAYRLPGAMPAALGLLIASKQYLPPAMALVPLLCGFHWRRIGITCALALATAAVVTVPFVLWDPHAFWSSVVTLTNRFPFRPDALNYLGWWSAGDASFAAPRWLGIAVLAAGIAICLWRAPRGPMGFAGSIALCFLLFFAFSKHAFANYYYFVIGAMCAAIGNFDRIFTCQFPPRDGS
jgi:hypothetical protein